MSTTYNVWCKQCQVPSPWEWMDLNRDSAEALVRLAGDILKLDRKANRFACEDLRGFDGLGVHVGWRRSPITTDWLYLHDGHVLEVRDEYGRTKEEW